jgi:hypothetical protein
VSWAVLSRARTMAALVSAMSTRVDAGTMAAARGGCGVLGPNCGGADVREVDKCRRWDYGGGASFGGSTGVEAGTVAAVGAVTCMLTRALATWSTLSSGMADESAWSASMLLRVGGKETFGGWSTCLLSS